MDVRFVFGLVISLLILASCGTENYPLYPAEPTPAPQAAPAAPVKTELPPTNPPESEPDTNLKWIPHDYDIVKRWKKPCTPVSGEAGKFVQEEIYFLDSEIRLASRFYTDALCTEGNWKETVASDLAFEEGWDPAVVSVGGVFLKGWSGLFMKEIPGAREQFLNVSVYLAEEDGVRVLYIRWMPTKPVTLDPAADRYLFVGP